MQVTKRHKHYGPSATPAAKARYYRAELASAEAAGDAEGAKWWRQVLARHARRQRAAAQQRAVRAALRSAR